MKVLSFLLALGLILGLSAGAAEEKPQKAGAEKKERAKGLSGKLEAKGADAGTDVVAVLVARDTKVALIASNQEVAEKITLLIGKRVKVAGEKVEAGFKVTGVEEMVKPEGKPEK